MSVETTETLPKQKRSRLSYFAGAIILVSGSLVLWNVLAHFGLEKRVKVKSRISTTGARLVYEERYYKDTSLVRRAIFKLPGGLGFADPFLLDAQQSEFSDKDVPLLTDVTNLRKLWLRGSEVTDAGLANLPTFPKLISFSVPAGTGEEGLVCLTRFPQLQSLQLTDASLSQSAVQAILELPDLLELDLRRAKIHPSLVTMISKSRPAIKIIR